MSSGVGLGRDVGLVREIVTEIERERINTPPQWGPRAGKTTPGLAGTSKETAGCDGKNKEWSAHHPRSSRERSRQDRGRTQHDTTLPSMSPDPSSPRAPQLYNIQGPSPKASSPRSGSGRWLAAVNAVRVLRDARRLIPIEFPRDAGERSARELSMNVAAIDPKVWSYLPLLLLILGILVGVPVAYRLWRETHEEDEPIRDADMLSDFEQAYVAGKMDEAEFRRIRDLVIGTQGGERRQGREEIEPGRAGPSPEDDRRSAGQARPDEPLSPPIPIPFDDQGLTHPSGPGGAGGSCRGRGYGTGFREASQRFSVVSPMAVTLTVPLIVSRSATIPW